MAYKTQEQVQAGYINNRKEAQAWLNLELVDKHGERHRLPKGLALYESKIETLLIKLAQENPDKEFQLVGKVYVPSDEATELELDL
jgi:hypothetical protein